MPVRVAEVALRRMPLSIIRAFLGPSVSAALADQRERSGGYHLPPLALLLEHPWSIRMANEGPPVLDPAARGAEVDAIVVGAGASGLAAAQYLAHEALLDVVVVEGRERLGGRVHTVRASAIDGESLGSSSAVDLGASFIHGASPLHEFVQMAEWLGHRTSEAPGGVWESPGLAVYAEEDGEVVEWTGVAKALSVCSRST
uniref:Amine oxidase domain-containing protein n=1 Tax=Lotharella globosa TaxID=91324 RepID=A0A7S3Z0D4_9EUKA